MREAAKYAFCANLPSSSDADFGWVSTCSAIAAWFSEKGISDIPKGENVAYLNDGRLATIILKEVSVGDDLLSSWEMQEPIEKSPGSSIFRTTLSACKRNTKIAVSCVLEVGNPQNIVAPVVFDAFCPKVIRDIVGLHLGWRVRDTEISNHQKRYSNDQDAQKLWSEISNPTRALPLVIVSEHSGFCLHPQLAARMARDLTGLANVVHVNDTVSWAMTRDQGVEWSCYNGAVRIYWPFGETEQNPYSHPLWTAPRLLQSAVGTEDAAKRIRNQIRRRVLGLSTLTIYRDRLFDDIHSDFQHGQQEIKKKEASTNEEWIAYIEDENSKLDSENLLLKEQIAKLQTDLANARALQSWLAVDTADVAPDTECLVTVLDAITKAKSCLKDELRFGDDALTGAEKVNYNKVPVEKIYKYLEGLARLAQVKRDGSLNKSEITWLNENGYSASPESATIRNSSDEMKKRTWHDGTGRRKFELHMKPTDAAHPDACVRIYFAWDSSAKIMVVGWVGRHPE